MTRFVSVAVLIVFVFLVQPPGARAVIEPETGTEYPDEIAIETQGTYVPLRATGAGLREKTFLQVDVYTIVSYIPSDLTLEGEPAAAIRALDAPKRLQMDLRRSFSREKLVNSFREVIEKNYEDTSAFAEDLETFLAYFDRDAQDGDVIIFEYRPAEGLTTRVNTVVKGVIDNFAFVEALWTVWFGEKPANKGLRQALVSAL